MISPLIKPVIRRRRIIVSHRISRAECIKRARIEKRAVRTFSSQNVWVGEFYNLEEKSKAYCSNRTCIVCSPKCNKNTITPKHNRQRTQKNGGNKRCTPGINSVFDIFIYFFSSDIFPPQVPARYCFGLFVLSKGKMPPIPKHSSKRQCSDNRQGVAYCNNAKSKRGPNCPKKALTTEKLYSRQILNFFSGSRCFFAHNPHPFIYNNSMKPLIIHGFSRVNSSLNYFISIQKKSIIQELS